MALKCSFPAPTANGVPGVYSSEVVKYGLLIPDTAYPLGGYPVTPGFFGLSLQIQSVTALSQGLVSGQWQTVYDPAYGTLRFLQVPATASSQMFEPATGTNLSSVQVTVQVIGW
jgi:hypothetical protein